jgi:hypothetical protein
LASFSNYGKNTVAVAAPGVQINSTYLGNKYKSLNGTSMAAPFVSGLAALILAKNPTMSVVQLKERILRTVDVIPALQGNTVTGGRINAYRALTEVTTGPYIYGISPEKGSVKSTVTIRGADFKADQGQVLFGGDKQAPITSWSDDKIVVKVPDGAVTGPVRVVTAEGTSNGVIFEVTSYPTQMRYSFPHASTEQGQVSYVIISNPLNQPATVNVNLIATISGEQTTKIVKLNAYEKRIWDLRSLGMVDESLIVDCESQDFFGAAVVTIIDDTQKIIAMPPIIGNSSAPPGNIR